MNRTWGTTGYPTTLVERRAARQRILDDLLERARQRAARNGKSMTCIWGTGCETANNTCVGGRYKSGCLCECHDPKGAAA